MSRTLLIDADIIAYRASAALQQTIDWGDGVVSVDGRLDEAKAKAKETVEWFMDELNADELVICLSDDVNNFRKGIDPTYKDIPSRTAADRPVHLYDLKDYLASAWPSKIIPTFEADDVMGIMATEPHKGERIIVSSDKDMKTIPGLLCRPDFDNHKLPVQTISEEEADRFHLWQTICGDSTDGYPGCPGAGPKAADRLLAGEVWMWNDRTISRGPRKGEVERDWAMRHPEEGQWNAWSAVCSAYLKAGLTEADAIRQARLAFILRSSHYVDGRRLDWHPSRAA